MRRGMLVICMFTVALLIASCADKKGSEEPVVGGWSSAAVTDANVVEAANVAVKAEAEALREAAGGEQVSLDLVAIREASAQVVAGMNYRLKLTVRLDGEEKKAEAVVWWQAWREPDPYQLTQWIWE